jgi:hypothetical protein
MKQLLRRLFRKGKNRIKVSKLIMLKRRKILKKINKGKEQVK